jgi:hypothetical protein
MEMDKNIWITKDDIKKHHPLIYIFEPNIQTFLNRLMDAHLIRGFYNRHEEILYIRKDSWEDLMNHIRYNNCIKEFATNIKSFAPETVSFPIPPYLSGNFRRQIPTNDKDWSPPAIVVKDIIPSNFVSIFSCKFINSLVKTGIVIGIIRPTEPHVLVYQPSLEALLQFRNWVIEKYRFYPGENF